MLRLSVQATWYHMRHEVCNLCHQAQSSILRGHEPFLVPLFSLVRCSIMNINSVEFCLLTQRKCPPLQILVLTLFNEQDIMNTSHNTIVT